MHSQKIVVIEHRMYKIICTIFLLFLIKTASSANNEKCSDPKAEYLTCKRCVGSCDDLNPICTESCAPAGCYCKEGFVKRSNSDPTCIPRSQCFVCTKNQVYQECGTACPLTCDNKDNPPSCTEECVEGCFCKSGFVKDTKTGKCVLPKNCPPPKCPKPNEEYSECGANICQNTCARPKNSLVCKGTCIAGCVCKEGYLKNSNGNCVLPKDCKECSGDHEVWTECDNNSCQRNCDTFGLTNIACKPICTPGCICERGFVRNSNGVCVSPPDCGTDICPEAKTEYTSCVPCDNTCEIYATNATCNFLVCNVGCTCKEGFYSNSKRQCVPPEQCDYCKANAVFSECDNHPCRDTCSDPTFSTRCRYDNSKCYPGCICEEGYLKDSKGNCLLKENCVTCPANEVYKTCGTACPITCENRNNPPQVCTDNCVEGCFCKDGYVRDTESKKCVLPNNCPPPKCPKPNEEYSECGANICQNTCKRPKNSLVCKGACIAGCVCKEGYLKNSNGDCILPEDCKECSGDHEVWTECDNNSCQRNCNTFGLTNLACKPICTPGCICERGFVRNSNGICVSPPDCGTNICPEANTEYSDCVPCDNTCEILATSGICFFFACNVGCTCKAGFYLNSKSKCVPAKQCDYCKANAVFSECDNHPCRDTCLNPTLSTGCKYDTSKCYPGCICEEGYLKDSQGNCMPKDKCIPKCDDPNAFYNGCGNNCALTCKNKDDPPVCSEVCLPEYAKCECNPGYAFDDKGICIRVEDCPVICPENELFKSCGTACPITCKNKDNPPKRCTKNCVRGCFCADGYVRDENSGKCVLPGNCPPPTCPANEEYQSCGTACPITCENKDNPPTTCTENCVQGCFCKDGYVRDTKSGNCVLPNKCPVPTCPANEEYQSCGTACPITCENKDNPPRTCTANCVEGCFCKDGYVRDTKSENCVLPNKCPAPKCPGPYERYSKCNAHPCLNNCEEPDLSTRCVYEGICYPGCVCNKGYLRNVTGSCVPEEQCPPKCSDPNEKYYRSKPCKFTCDRPSFTCAAVSIPGCECKEGYIRKSDNDDTCIPKDSCPKTCKDPNSEYLSCKRCVGSCDNRNPICNRSCKPAGCYCKVGYIKKSSTDPTCIKKSACPTTKPHKCKRNEVWSENCLNAPETCEYYAKPRYGKKPGCCCKPGYVRKYKGGPCIHEHDC